MPVPTGTNLYAARGGVVTYVYEDSNQNCTTKRECDDNEIVGNGIRILHEDGTRMSYWHLRPNGAFVAEGERVVRGQLIGETGNTGFSTGPHLHLQHNVPTWNGWVFGNASFHTREFELSPLGFTERFCWEFDDDEIIFQLQ